MTPATLARICALTTAIGLASCAPMKDGAATPRATGTADAPSPQATDAANAETPGFVMPEQVNYTPFGQVLLIAKSADGDYFSLGAKITFDFDAQGRMTLASHQEPVIDEHDDPAQDGECTGKGGGGNQRTTWFPDTAIFVRGGALQSVLLAPGKPVAAVPLSRDERGFMMVMGAQARQTEFFFVPCVGGHRVARGHRLNGFLPHGATLLVKPEKGGPVQLTLPQPVEPYVLLRYRAGAMIPVPMRPVLVTVDTQERRVVVQYQTTFALAPPLRKIELRAVLPGGKPAPDETAERFRERTDAMLNDLRQCPPPTRPMDPCASPLRVPDRRIFSP